MTDHSSFRVEPLSAPVKMPERVTAALLELIRNGNYPAKSRLPSEMEMAQSFGVSRTVIREAISRLKSEGLVESRQGSGVFVREAGLDAPFRIDPAVVGSVLSVLQVVELRRGLEAEMAALAAERATRQQVAEIRASLRAIDKAVAKGEDGVAPDIEFHRSIARATGNPHFLALWDFISQFLKTTIAITRAWEARRAETARQVQDEHLALYEAIAKNDPDAARAAALQHLGMSARRIRTADPEFLKGGPSSRPASGKPAARRPPRQRTASST